MIQPINNMKNIRIKHNPGPVTEWSNFRKASGRFGNQTFPIGVFSPALGKWILNVSASIGCSNDYVIAGLLAAASAAAGKKYKAIVKDGFDQYGNIFIGIIGQPSTGKTPALERMTKPLYELQDKLQMEFWEELKSHQSSKLVQKAMKVDDGAKTKKGKTKKPKLEDSAKATGGGVVIPIVPYKEREILPIMKPQLITSNTTFEALVEILKYNRTGILIHTDELNSLFAGFNQYKGGSGNDLPNFLSLWSNADINYNRRGWDGPVCIKDPFATLIGGIQPYLFQSLNKLQGIGFIDRFLWLSDDSFFPSEQPLDLEQYSRYSDFIKQLGQRDCVDYGEQREPRVVRFQQEAFHDFYIWQKKLFEEMKMDGFPFELRGPWGKMGNYIPRLCLLFHLLGNYPSRPINDTIDKESIRKAILAAEYFMDQAEKVQSLLAQSLPVFQRNKLLDFIRKNGSVTLRDVYTNKVGGISNAAEAERIAKECVEDQLITILTSKGPGRHSKTLIIYDAASSYKEMHSRNEEDSADDLEESESSVDR
jgi:hypothetical protein